MKIIYTKEEQTYFLEEFTYIFLPLEIKVSIFWNHKNIYNLFRKTELSKSLSPYVFEGFDEQNMWRHVGMRNFNLKNGT